MVMHCCVEDICDISTQALKLVMTRDVPSSVANCCGEEAVTRLSLARADLYISLASTSSHLSTTSTLTRGLNVSPTSPSPSPSATPPVTSPSLLPPSSTKPASRSTSQRQSHLIQSLLLENAEKLLTSSCLCLSSLTSSPELRIRAYLSLSRLALSLHHDSTATKLSLAALRVLQSSSSLSSPALLHRLWLEGRHLLARSLVGKRERGKIGDSVLDCAAQCEVGTREAERFGEAEWCAEFNFTAALHALSLSPPNLDTIMKHSQSCLQLLASLPHLSPPLSLLHARCTLLLCDAGCHGGHVTSHDATLVYRRLVKRLKQQV